MHYASLLTIFWVLISTSALAQETPQAHTVRIRIQNIQATTGIIRLAVYPSEHGFPGDTQKASYLLNIKPSSQQEAVLLEAIPEGVYAIAVLHDKNENGRMDTNFLGYPTEAYGFSNNVRPMFRAPNFKEASFSVHAGLQELKISLQ